MSKKTHINIATRRSQLALWQAEHVRERLMGLHPELTVDLVPIKTQGDRIIDRPLAKIGGKGLFIKELQAAILEGRADIAVHSMKDVPVDQVDGLHITTILERADPRDALLAIEGRKLSALRRNATVGTSSLRRKSQLAALRPDLDFRDLRGNVPTRLDKLKAGEFDAIVLAAAGLKRLSLDSGISESFDASEIIPAVGQGAIGIECRNDDESVNRLITPLNHDDTSLCVHAERSLSRQLNGSCEIPIAAHAVLSADAVNLTGLVASLDGQKIIRATGNAERGAAENLGETLGQRLLDQGARAIIAQAIKVA